MKYDNGQTMDYKNIESEQKMLRMAKFLSKERKLREKRRRKELRRSQQLIDNILQFSILMNSGTSNFMQSFNLPQLGGVNQNINMFQNFAPGGNQVGMIGAPTGNLYLDPSLATPQMNPGMGGGVVAGGNNQQGGSNRGRGQKTQEEIENEKLRKRRKRRKERKREKRRRRKAEEEAKKRIADEEAKELENAIDVHVNRGDRLEQEAIKNIQEERERKKREAEEQARLAQDQKDREEAAQRKKLEKMEQ